MEIGIIGTSIWQQNMPLLERLTVARDNQAAVLQELKAYAGFGELIYLSTCNRVEFVYAVDGDSDRGRYLHRIIDFFFRNQRDIPFFPNDFYHYSGREAMAHLFRTTSSLESLIVGETQITGQFKQAYQSAVDTGLAGSALSNLAQEALQVAKKVKRETSIGQGCLSMASLAADSLCKSIRGNSNPVVALVGSGSMTVKMAKHLRNTSSARLLFVNRTVEKIEKLAEEHGGDVMSLSDFLEAPVAVDALVSATAATEPVFDSDFLSKLEAYGKPVVCIDLAVPGDFSQDYIDSTLVQLTNISQLKSRGQGNLRQKFVEAGKANDIVRESVSEYLANQIEVSLKPIFHSSYQESVALAKQALEDLFSKRITGLEKEDQDAVVKLVTKLISHSSFQPVRKLSDHLVERRSRLDLPEPCKVRKEAV